MPRLEIRVWDALETVTWIDGQDANTMRVVWHRSDGGVDERFDVRPDGESRPDAIARELRKRLQDPQLKTPPS